MYEMYACVFLSCLGVKLVHFTSISLFVLMFVHELCARLAQEQRNPFLSAVENEQVR